MAAAEEHYVHEEVVQVAESCAKKRLIFILFTFYTMLTTIAAETPQRQVLSFLPRKVTFLEGPHSEESILGEPRRYLPHCSVGQPSSTFQAIPSPTIPNPQKNQKSAKNNTEYQAIQTLRQSLM